MTRLKEGVVRAVHTARRFVRKHRVAVVSVSSVLIVALVVQTVFFKNVPEVKAALTNIRQEVNILNGYFSAASGLYATSSEIISIDPSKYNDATFYLEIVASTTIGARDATISLVNAATGATARSITINSTAYDRYRSTSFTVGAATEYRLKIYGESTGVGLLSARVIIIQNSSAITTTQTQVEIGARQNYTSGTLSGLSAPKYWKYDSSKWDGSPTFYAEAVYGRVSDVTVASSTTYTTSGSRSFTVPSNVASSTVVELWAGGGAGGAATTNTSGSGSGGGGGQYARSVINGLAGQTKTVVVAAAQAGGAGNGATGNDSTWDSTVVVAKGGGGGGQNSGTAGAGGGFGGAGDVLNGGGSGAAGVSGGTSGGGGEGGRSTGIGGSASGGTGGTGGDGGDGGAGRATNGAGNPGSAPGGGGAGGRSTGNPNVNGGNGAEGRAIIRYNLSVNATTTIVLQESDGTGDGFVGWTDKITIVSGGSASTPTRVRSSSFTPTSGRNYRIAVREGYNGATHAIYAAKIIVDQASSPTKLEAQYLLANRTLFAGTALQKYHTYWDAAEWTNAANTYTHQVDAANGSASVVEIDTEGGTQVTGSVVTSPDNSGVSSSMTMPATGDLDVKATTNNGDVYASRILVAVTPDTTAPTPNPYFTTAPNSTTTDMVSMTSVTITDTNAVSYYFNPVAGSCGGNVGTGTTSSGWVSSPTYYDTGLQINKCYAYTVTGKDAAGNTTATSTASTTYTRAAVPGAMTYGSVGVTSFRIFNTENSNPASNPTTNFAVLASSTDNRWDYYLTAAAGTSTSPVWLSDAQLDNLELTGLRPNTRYDFSVVARNQNQILTATSTQTGTTTLADTVGPTPSPATFSSAPNDVSATAISMTATLGSDAAGSTPISYFFDYTSTCASDNGTGGTDSGWLSGINTYTDSSLEVNKCYAYTTRMRDSLGNMGATSTPAVYVYTAANVPSAPTLSNAGETTFDIDNNANGNPTNTQFTAQIIATSPSDTDWNGKYIDTDGTPSDTKVWMSDSTLDAITVTGLDFSKQYTVQTMARNGDNEETASSTTSNISTNADGTAPASPTFSSAPSNDSTSQISMTTNSVSDPSTPVEYFFDAVAGSCGAALGTGGTDSGWQTGTSHSDDGLQTNKCYAYTVSARDANANTSSASAAAQTYTSAAVPGAPTQVSVTDTSITLSINANGNPASNPTTYFAIQVSATTDGTWLNQYVDASGNPSGTAVWRTASEFTNFVVQGLQSNTGYTFRVKARNQDNDETAFGSTQTMTTAVTQYPETRIQGGTRLQGIRVY